jgi:hypothetical protein
MQERHLRLGREMPSMFELTGKRGRDLVTVREDVRCRSREVRLCGMRPDVLTYGLGARFSRDLGHAAESWEEAFM